VAAREEAEATAQDTQDARAQQKRQREAAEVNAQAFRDECASAAQALSRAQRSYAQAEQRLEDEAAARQRAVEAEDAVVAAEAREAGLRTEAAHHEAEVAVLGNMLRARVADAVCMI
jgi:hypothetical protein